MNDETCQGCRFFVADPHIGGNAAGVCRRFPPETFRHDKDHPDFPNAWASTFPVVKASGWCGEFKVNPN